MGARRNRHLKQRREGSALCIDPRRDERLAAVFQDDAVTRLKLWRRMHEGTDVIPSCVVNAVEQQHRARG
jgi:hypothetical protein